MLHHSFHSTNKTKPHSIILTKQQRHRIRQLSYNQTAMPINNKKSHLSKPAAIITNGKKQLISEKPQLLKEGKLKLHNFLNNITNFENNLRVHRRYMNDVIKLQQTVKKDMYDRYKSLEESKVNLKVKDVKITTKNLNLSTPYVECVEFKPAKQYQLADNVAIKPLRNPHDEYIKKMTKMKISNKENKQRESMQEQMVMNVNQNSFKTSKLSVLHRVMKFKSSIATNSKLKGKVQMVLFNNMLFHFVKKNNTGKVKEILIKNPDLVNKEDKNGNTLLNVSIQLEYIEMVKLLVALGANVNQPDECNVKPLKLAYDMNHADIFKVRS